MDTIDAGTKHSTLRITTPKRTVSKLTTITLPNAWVEQVEIHFAPGHAALTAVAIKYAGNTIIPWDGVGTYIVGDNERLCFPIEMFLPGLITVQTINSDGYDHGHIVTFKWHTWKPPALAQGANVPTIIA